ncbi:hypothetical protein, partial [Vibrio cholerae]|uniref:hypothetical protein n=1 Tax=Vibrio cholerae TaxID=666 RepID=UPI001BCC30FE
FDDQVFNGGLISGANGVAVDMGGGNDTLTLNYDTRFEGMVDGGTGHNTMIMDGHQRYSWYGKPDGVLNESRNFQSLEVRKGFWLIDGKTDFNQGVQVFSGALLENQGAIAGDVVVDQYAEY